MFAAKPPPTLLQKILTDVHLAEKIFKEDRIIEAYFLFLGVESFLKSVEEEDVVDEVQKYIDSSSTIANMIEKGHALHTILASIDKASLWSIWNEKLGPHQDVTMYIHKDTPEGQYSFKTEGFLRDSGILEVAAAILESSLFKYWMPMCTECKLLSTETAYRRIIQLDFDFVLLKKIAVVVVRGDVLPDGRLFLSFEPLPKEDDPTLKYLPHNKELQMDLTGAVLLTEEAIVEKTEKNDLEDLVDFVTSRQPVMNADSKADEEEDAGGDGSVNASTKDQVATTPTRESFLGVEAQPATTVMAVKTQLIFRADIKIDFIPDWIFNLAIRSTTSMVVPMLEHQATLFGKGEVHHHLMESNAAVYELIEARQKDYENRPAKFPALVKRKSSKKKAKTVEQVPLHGDNDSFSGLPKEDSLAGPVDDDNGSVVVAPPVGMGEGIGRPPPLMLITP